MAHISINQNNFPAQPASPPQPFAQGDVQRNLERWEALRAAQEDTALATWMQTTAGSPLLRAVFGNSAYLSRLLLLYPAVLRDMETSGPEAVHAALSASLADFTGSQEQEALMQLLRIAKEKLALLVGLADMDGRWNLEQVTGALSGFAEQCLTLTVDTLLHAGQARGEIELPHPDAPSHGSGIIVLGMGKLGGRELNYSSDIDLIIFFEPGRLSYKGRHTEQQFMNKLAYDLVHIMQERTRHGYVFRTDLRLRPDPASTPPAVTTGAAYFYYESVGQNWERAAMIKARAVAGDLAAGEKFLKGLAPFMWRRSLDFAAINDIHSIKRQMDSVHSKSISINGHNIKLGKGGIREIEFYVQIHQLIWGGKIPLLRSRATCETLARLTEHGMVEEPNRIFLTQAYAYLRKLEHRLQMVADEQTHTMPDSDEGVAHIACFMGYANTEDFRRNLTDVLERVHSIYASSFRSAEVLGEEGGNLVFTGVSHDPETLVTLRGMGYTHPETVSEIVMGWHHGSSRATRTKRARELLTEMMPLLLKRLSETANPDAAFLKFSDFLSNLPSGVQLFSLFSMNPQLLRLIADIMGSAPTLADALSKSPDLLDAVLYADFYGALPTADILVRQLDEELQQAENLEEQMDVMRHFRNEKQFQAGVHMLGGMIAAPQAAAFLSILAEVCLRKTLAIIEADFARTYGTIKDAQFAIIALGKLGSCEMTFSSDIDLVFIYDVEDFERFSDGDKPFTASVYYNRMAQRFVNALSAMGHGGRLYEVDTRLRPSGKQGLLAVSKSALSHYFTELAWTFEYMAFTKARAVAGNATLCKALDTFIVQQIARPRDMEKLCIDAADMRERVDKEHGTHNPWDIKYVRGGLMDIDFIAQYLMLRHAPEKPGAHAGSASENFCWLREVGALAPQAADELITADHFLGQIFNMLRLCCDRKFEEETALPGLKKLLAETSGEKDFVSLKARLVATQAGVYGYYHAVLEVN